MVFALPPPRLVEGRAMRLAGLRRELPASRVRLKIPLIWAELMGTRLAGQLSGVGYRLRSVACDGGTITYSATIEIANTAPLPPGIVAYDVPAALYAIFDGFDHVSDLRAAWGDIIDQWLPRSGRRLADTPSFERFGEDFDPLSGQGEMAIWLAISPDGE